MSSEKQVNTSRRGLMTATCAAGGVAGLATGGLLLCTLGPTAKTQASGAPVEVDISALQPGHMMTVAWRGQPVWVLRRTPEMIASLDKTTPECADPQSLRTSYARIPDYAKNDWRSIRQDILVVIGICPHLGCSPVSRFTPGAQPALPDDWQGGFLCPCHASTFDLAGRVFKNKPAADNLQVPRHMYLDDNRLLIGKDAQGEAA